MQIWQEDGLDLCLIPYGCVATGPNSGIIEVVKDAKTVADVSFPLIQYVVADFIVLFQISGITDNTKLLQWIEDHQREYAMKLHLTLNSVTCFLVSLVRRILISLRQQLTSLSDHVLGIQ